VYRPLSEVAAEVERETPPVKHPTAVTHPVTGETVLYINEGFTYQIEDGSGQFHDTGVLRTLLEHAGQLDKNFDHPYIHLQTFELGDLLIWDNRSLVHCARHSTSEEPTVSYRLTLHDNHSFCMQ
jgi:taurine dioxygenase